MSADIYKHSLTSKTMVLVELVEEHFDSVDGVTSFSKTSNERGSPEQDLQ